jgi:hypothetical protein
MIRFMPDTWRDALLRPVAMAMPDGWVYTEIIAPDLRFVFILLLFALLAVMLPMRRCTGTAPLKPVLILLVCMTAGFLAWMLTTGNGRYFIPFLLVAGPLCLALVYALPMTQGFRVTVAICLVALQACVVYDSAPFKSWGWTQWREAPYFQIDIPQDMATQPKSYVTVSIISYSLIAPLLPSTSKWMNISDAPSDPRASLAGKRVHSFLAAGGDQLTLLVPSIPEYATAQGLPNNEVVRSINVLLAEHRVTIAQPHACRLLHSKGLLSRFKQDTTSDATKTLSKVGFWVCPLLYPTAIPTERSEIGSSKYDAVFAKVETLCPRFFRPGEAKTKMINGGELRHYMGADMRVYVWDDGFVMYKYHRSLNPALIGTIADVMSGKATVNCDKIKGRSGLPWEREI